MNLIATETNQALNHKPYLTQTEPVPDQQSGAENEEMTAILELLETYIDQMRTHPLQSAFLLPNTPRSLIEEFAGIQYVDSVLWVPMLAIMKDRVTNEKLYAALKDNLLCEAGANHESHVMLCQRFIKSIGLSPFYGNFNQYSGLASHPVEMMNGVSGMSEEQIAGFNLVSEGIVPYLFKMVLPAVRKLPGADPQYLTDHITVDADDHAQAMIDAIEDMLAQGFSAGSIMEGMHLSGRTALSIPDALYAKYLRGAFV